MAVTKIHPIKATLKKALDYIENPAKTDEKMLVSSFACSYETADIEFELLLSQANAERQQFGPPPDTVFCAGRNHAGAGPRDWPAACR